MPKTEFLQIRLTPEQREQMRLAAEAEHLDLSTWARRILLNSLDASKPARGSARGKIAGTPGPDKLQTDIHERGHES